MERPHNVRNFSWIILSILVVILFVFSGLFAYQMNRLRQVSVDINQIEYLSASSQRMLKLLLDGRDIDKSLISLDEDVHNYFTEGTASSLSVLGNKEITEQIIEIVGNWTTLKGMIDVENKSEINYDDLYLLGENYYFKMTDLTALLNEHGAGISSDILKIEMILLCLLLSIGVIIANNAIQTTIELKKSKALAKAALLDVATGLYNRSKCQELFHSTEVPGKKRNAIIVFDLNDLKKANDVYGHRIGDELIASFATSLKTACGVHSVKPFMGRYGGDEFIVYYENIQTEEDIPIFLKELDYVTEIFNATETRFQLSYATGSAINSTDHNLQLTMRQLFDKADEAMYENKEAIKKSRAESTKTEQTST